MDNKSCKIHNQPVIFVEKDAKQNLKQMCQFCIQQKLNVQNTEDIENKQKQALQQLEQKYDQSIYQLKDLADKLYQYTQQIKQKLKRFKQQVEQNISQIIEKKNKVIMTSNNFTNLQLNQINDEENIINNYFEQMKQLINNQLKELEVNTKLDQLNQSINKFSIDMNNQMTEQIQIQKITQFNKKFDYQLMQQSCYKYNQYCTAIAFNNNATLMIASCNELIKVFEFKGDKLREVQQLNGHQQGVTCLQFMKKSNQFLSASNDSTLIIWEYSQTNKWQNKQVLKDNKSDSFCITMNQNEDLLISGSGDKTIKFWNKYNNIWSCNQSINCLSEIWSISLSDQGDQLIASVRDKQILILQFQDKQWQIKQTIQVEKEGLRLCYINQDQFVFQSTDGQYLQIFDYDPKDYTFKRGQELQYSNKAPDDYCLFPIRYISQIGLTMVKHREYIHLIKRHQNGQFTVEQSINFNTDSLFGGITDDGRYMTTWDYQSNEIQIRKFDY